MAFERLKKTFSGQTGARRAAAPAVAALTLALVVFPSAASAEDPAAKSPANDARPVASGSEVAGELKSGDTVSAKEAYRASTDRIVLHYGEGIMHPNLYADALDEMGYPALALAGGPRGKVKIWAARRPVGEFGQESLRSGVAVTAATMIYEELVGPPRSSATTTTGNNVAGETRLASAANTPQDP